MGIHEATHVVRLIVEADIPFLLDLGKRRSPVEFDAQSTEMWARNIVLKSPLLFYPVRTDHAFMVCNLVRDAWEPGVTICNNMLLHSEAGAVWEEVALVRAAVEWARRRHCTEYRIWSDTSVDMQAIARRVGAEPSAVRYTVRL
jgi:hypothetical protein